MKQALTQQVLRQMNNKFKNTGSVSEENRDDGFHPAFYDPQCDSAEVSCFSDGTPAPIHVLEAVAKDWVTKRDYSAKVAVIKASIISGFIHRGMVYIREQASYLCSQHV